MENLTKIILNQALELPANERAILAEQLLMSLDLPDSKLDELWAADAEARINEYENGKIQARLAEEVFDKYKK